MRKKIIGVMGPGESADAEASELAFELGRRIAEEGWILLSGGMAAGVMEAASRGAKEAGGFTLGILPGKNEEGVSGFLDVALKTGMGSGRNNINVLSSDLVIVCGMSAGTASEAALALKAEKPVILLGTQTEAIEFFKKLDPERVYIGQTAGEAVSLARTILSGGDTK